MTATTTTRHHGTAVLFDLDGVLLDSREAMRKAIRGTATAALGRRVADSELGPEADRLPHHAVLARLGVHDRETVLGAAWESAFAVAAQDVAPFDGALEVVRELRSRGTAVGAVTLQPRSRLSWLLPAELTGLLQVVIGWGDAEPKPSGEGITLALERLGVRPSRACFVGDSPSDIEAARAAGVVPVGASWGYTGPALAAHRPAVLLHALSQVPGAVTEALAP
ncbi:HAD family hydrolase [Streptomyces sp. NPDC087297]|uniref:HAD family hydrolase n=1 Tax=Streptomyces sp. NPDC087297 TaxID=3365778 RepID=UPI0038108E1D